MTYQYSHQLAQMDLDYPAWATVKYHLTEADKNDTFYIIRMYRQPDREPVGHAIIITEHNGMDHISNEDFGIYENYPYLASINVKYKRQGLGSAMMREVYEHYGGFVFDCLCKHLFYFYHTIGCNIISGEPYSHCSFAYGIDVPKLDSRLIH